MPAISGDGRFVAFVSLADNLVPGDTNGFADTIVHDRLTNVTERVSLSNRGRQGNNHSGLVGVGAYPAISSDGRFVVFVYGGDGDSCEATAERWREAIASIFEPVA